MNIEQNEVYTFKIANGDEIVAKIENINDTTYEISKPLVIVPTSQGIQMISGLFTAHPDKNVVLNKHAISMIALAREEVCDSYREATTGIKTPSKKLLLG
jgi:hypothetical protein